MISPECTPIKDWPPAINELGASAEELFVQPNSSVVDERATPPEMLGDDELADEAIIAAVEAVPDASIDMPDPPQDPPGADKTGLSEPEPEEPSWSEQMGQGLRYLAKQKGYTVATVARLAGSESAAVDRLLKGKVTTNPELTQKVANVVVDSTEAVDNLTRLQRRYTLGEVAEAAAMSGDVIIDTLFEDEKEAYDALTSPERTPESMAQGMGLRKESIARVAAVDNHMAHKALILAPQLMPVIDDIRTLGAITDARYSQAAYQKLAGYLEAKGQDIHDYLPTIEPELEQLMANPEQTDKQIAQVTGDGALQVRHARHDLLATIVDTIKETYSGHTPQEVQLIREAQDRQGHNIQRDWRHIGQQANVVRLLQGHSIADIAAEADIAPADLRNFFESRTRLNDEAVAKILRGLGYTEYELQTQSAAYAAGRPEPSRDMQRPTLLPVERAEDMRVSLSELHKALSLMDVTSDRFATTEQERAALAYAAESSTPTSSELADHLGITRAEAAGIIRRIVTAATLEYPRLTTLVSHQRQLPPIGGQHYPWQDKFAALHEQAAQAGDTVAAYMPRAPIADAETDHLLIDSSLTDRQISVQTGYSLPQVRTFRRRLLEHVQPAFQAVHPPEPPPEASQPQTSPVEKVSDILYRKVHQTGSTMGAFAATEDINLTDLNSALTGDTYRPRLIGAIARKLGFSDQDAVGITRQYRDALAIPGLKRTGPLAELYDLPVQQATSSRGSVQLESLAPMDRRVYGLIANPRLSEEQICMILRVNAADLSNIARRIINRLRA